MPVIDFREIPKANKSTGKQDAFELFARDFLEQIGYIIIQHPGRGQDGGKDIVVQEIRKGVGGESRIKWLVSCKHHAHGTTSVGIADEPNIMERVTANKCNGFLGFYSTLPSSGLIQRLEGLKSEIDCDSYDCERIEKYLLASSDGLKLASRYFPVSISKHRTNTPKAEKYFWHFPDLPCKYCGRNLLELNKTGIIVIWKSIKKVVNIYCCCKGNCDQTLKHKYLARHNNVFDGWEDICDLCIPTIYAKWMNTIFNDVYMKEYTKTAFKEMKNLMLAIFPYVSRGLTEEEKDTIKKVSSIPSFLGGLG